MSDFREANVGDRVWYIARGWGEIFEIDGSCIYPINVKFDYGFYETFTFCGRSLSTHESPTLFWDEIKITPPPRPKRKVKKTLEGWVNVYPLDGSKFHSTKEEADMVARRDRITCVRVSGEYEVEE